MLGLIAEITLLFIVYVTGVRLLGKSALAQLTAHDFGAIFFLAYVLFGSIDVKGISQGLAGGITVIILYLTISKLTLINKLNKYLIGDSTYLIKHGKIMSHNLKKSRYTLMELLSTIRTAGYFDISDIDYALLEPNGEISILPKKDKTFVTPSHLDIDVSDPGLPIIVIIEGKIQHNHLDSLNKDVAWLENELKQKGFDHTDGIFLATVRDKDLNLNVYSEQNF
ncbi:DUF421 domain-containing protein [Filobacillus milosensis]|uniref:DUF421 domain-containing protein n=1 Tax=Filobacillus milosensis TaxID=94137 RepID=A0A4Y8ITL9_9BACI|nr:DUF421 domain-containing protein [Filobacillus milosensis]TFB24051.1 DUF421 domain-containing protein [Filobacillus milosensis]